MDPGLATPLTAQRDSPLQQVMDNKSLYGLVESGSYLWRTVGEKGHRLKKIRSGILSAIISSPPMGSSWSAALTATRVLTTLR